MQYNIYNDNMLNLNNLVEPNSVDSIVTDPPYELNFMGKGWDNAGVSFDKNTWRKCFDVLKEGGYLLAFGGSRTYHRIACAIEDAGFEIRDTIMWLYGSGFPKSMNIGLAIDKKNGVESKVIGQGKSGSAETHARTLHSQTKDGKDVFGGEYQIKEAQNEWQGWGTALKPSFEPIIVARKPFKGSLVDNIIKNGVGGINIDECRVGDEKVEHTGRFPANTILTYDETDYEEVCGGFPYTKSTGGSGKASQVNTFKNVRMGANGKNTGAHLGGLGDSGSASRYFYCAKASKKDRDEGLNNFKNVSGANITGRKEGSAGLVMEGEKQNPFAGKASPNNKNIHPTVKPTQLMQYLVRLVTPKGGTVLDPFNGSGSTGKAVAYENIERGANYSYIGIEQNKEYVEISKARIDYVIKKYPILNGVGKEQNETNI